MSYTGPSYSYLQHESRFPIFVSRYHPDLRPIRAVPSAGGGGVIVGGKVPFLRAGALFLMPNHAHHQQGALNLGLPPPPPQQF